MSKTIQDFSYQWTKYTDNDGYYGSKELFADIVEPLFKVAGLEGKTVLEIGSGTGRIVNMIMEYNAAHVFALEPSDSFFVLQKNTAEHADRLTLLRLRGDEIPEDLSVDVVVSIGVIHHIPDAAAVLRKAYSCLKPGGDIVVWLYGKENNQMYLSVVQPLRGILKRLPKKVTGFISWVLVLLLQPYIKIIEVTGLRFPLARYLKSVFVPISLNKQYLVVFDQLNPAYAKYYTKVEAEALLNDAGFVDVKIHHRHGYSWTVVGRK
ncbi:MAG: class I SAM-dependent methyltransferase [Proteobacteria bacterium]|nr:class I SAM-dependent methyltransferase [Pseudomonadota bacterium]MBU1610732.1 class I SAM-dependent methyltransferase [Pseudomonadota bacterium]